MNCLHPLVVPYFKDKKKNERLPSKMSRWKVIPCGKCVNCQSRLRNNWSFRLMHQMEKSKNNFFVTLTYDDSAVPLSSCGYLSLRKVHLDTFLRKFRDDCQSIYEKQFTDMPYKERHKQRCPMKFFAIGDYGEKSFRPHYHFIVFDCPLSFQALYEYIHLHWYFGSVNQVVRCVSEHCNYITKYIVKVAYNEDELAQYGCEPTFRSMSRGLGLTLVDSIHEYEMFDLKRSSWHKGKASYSLPSYVKRKLYEKRYD